MNLLFSKPPLLILQFLDSEEHLDILVNNAGLVQVKRYLTEDGNEMTFQCNHLGHFLLTNLLLSKLKESTAARIVNVSSLAHAKIWTDKDGGKFDLDDLNCENQDYNDGGTTYARSKLANVLFTKELAKRLAPENNHVTTYVLHPGVVETEVRRSKDLPAEQGGNRVFYWFWIFFYPLIKLLFKNPR